MSSESFSSEEVSPEEPHESAHTAETEGISRREFLAGTAALLSTGFARGVEANEAEEIPPDPETMEDSSYNEGLRVLREKVFTEDRERQAYYYKMKDGTDKWQYLDEEGITNFSFETPEEITRRFGSDVENLKQFHTHPAFLLYRDDATRKMTIEKINSGEISPPSLPPSFMDVTGVIMTSGEMSEETAKQIEWGVADPGGVWEMRPHRQNPFFKEIFHLFKDLEQTAEKLRDNDEIEVFLHENNLEDTDIRLMFEVLHARKDEFSANVQSVIDTIVEIDEKIRSDPAVKEIIDLEYSAGVLKQGSEDLEKLVKRYSDIGVTIQFSPYTDEQR